MAKISVKFYIKNDDIYNRTNDEKTIIKHTF